MSNWQTDSTAGRQVDLTLPVTYLSKQRQRRVGRLEGRINWVEMDAGMNSFCFVARVSAFLSLVHVHLTRPNAKRCEKRCSLARPAGLSCRTTRRRHLRMWVQLGWMVRVMGGNDWSRSRHDLVDLHQLGVPGEGDLWDRHSLSLSVRTRYEWGSHQRAEGKRKKTIL